LFAELIVVMQDVRVEESGVRSEHLVEVGSVQRLPYSTRAHPAGRRAGKRDPPCYVGPYVRLRHTRAATRQALAKRAAATVTVTQAHIALAARRISE
jgi:hypothetical protein